MKCKKCGQFAGKGHKCCSVMWAKLNGKCRMCHCGIRETEREKDIIQCQQCGEVYNIYDFTTRPINVKYVTGTGKCRWDLNKPKKKKKSSLTSSTAPTPAQ